MRTRRVHGIDASDRCDVPESPRAEMRQTETADRARGIGKGVAALVTIRRGIRRSADTNTIQDKQNGLATDQAYTCFSLHLQTCTRRSENFHVALVLFCSDVTIRIG